MRMLAACYRYLRNKIRFFGNVAEMNNPNYQYLCMFPKLGGTQEFKCQSNFLV